MRYDSRRDGDEVTIRLASSGDTPALARLAALDSADLPRGPILLAEAGGMPVAALPVQGGRSIADPFQHTAALVELLELRAAQLRSSAERAGAASLGQRLRATARSLSPGTG